MKKVLFIAILSTLLLQLKAQENKVQFKVGAALGIPTGFLQLSHGIGYGVVLDADVYKISPTLNIYGETGVLFFSGKSFLGDKSPIATHIPILGGIRYKSTDFFVGLGIGYGYYNFGSGNGSESGFSLSPNIGYSLSKVDIIAKYNSTTTSSVNANYISIGGVYKF